MTSPNCPSGSQETRIQRFLPLCKCPELKINRKIKQRGAGGTNRTGRQIHFCWFLCVFVAFIGVSGLFMDVIKTSGPAAYNIPHRPGSGVFLVSTDSRGLPGKPSSLDISFGFVVQLEWSRSGWFWHDVRQVKCGESARKSAVFAVSWRLGRCLERGQLKYPSLVFVLNHKGIKKSSQIMNA